MNEVPRPAAHPAHLGWRLLALVYDFFPVLALWMVTSGSFLLIRGGTPVTPGSLGSWVELFALWAVTGVYAVWSWRRGGQTLGMRPWRLKVVRADGAASSTRTLWLRYTVATLSLLPCGLGLIWAFFDAERRTWYDIAAGTLFVRLDR